MFDFTIHKTDSKGFARAGTFTTAHGDIQTPIFMPVGTNATVKGITKEQIEQIGSQIILANTYHLNLRPGPDTIEHFGGLHKFMNVDLPILTDSGGFQVFSLGNTRSGESLVKIKENGVQFRSHLNGEKMFFTPESAMQVQEQLGADIIMAFDECAPGDSPHWYARAAMNRTHRWAKRCVDEHKKLQVEREKKGQYPQALFPIVQGVVFDDLRVESAKFIGDLDCPGVAIGGLSVGETKKQMYHTLDVIAPHLPEHKPHYLMGVGTPEDLVEAIDRGIDMFDCVLPTRLGRHAVAFSSYGNIKVSNKKFEHEEGWILMKPWFETYVSKNYSLGYLRHLLKVGEMLGGQLLSLHNLEFLITITKKARQAILDGTFQEFKKGFFEEYEIKE